MRPTAEAEARYHLAERDRRYRYEQGRPAVKARRARNRAAAKSRRTNR